MPHLSPMNWVLVPISMIFLLMLMMVIMWWQFLPHFPHASKTRVSQLNIKAWKWW
uniref:ATP synthase F0 subunit 8 n=1 Tax=Platynereis bicanaliculata TaxID=868042 RepID=A0A7G8JTL9_9ANNE|nr:ATP synthase F0 subunit 8 [Platynereis bicanaliculata]QNJ33917.1 ATP synthase F0 subunit 8 [Platynereis bicanaliculata]